MNTKNTPKLEINLDELRIWITALRSGEYQQSDLTLQNGDGFCCLGVACKVLIPKDQLELNGLGFIAGGFPAAQPHAPEWLKNINDDYLIKDEMCRSLSNLNDTDGYSFTQIADVLEKTYLTDGNQ